jgi:hypothetical protein
MINILNYGGGIQSVAICVLILRGHLDKPDRVVIADTGYEVQSTWIYIEEHTQPLLADIGLQIEVAPHSLSRYDLVDRSGGLLMPMHTSTGQMRTFCSANWKRDVVNAHLEREHGIRDMCKWIGFSLDERRRATLKPERKGIAIRYPLLELHLTRQDCKSIIMSAGLPLPRKSRCYFCPHQSNAEWSELRDMAPDEWDKAVRFDEKWRDAMPTEVIDDSRVYLHRSRLPLSQADLSRTSGENMQCGMGMCFL